MNLPTHVYSHIYGLPITCLGFYSIDAGRPNMALFNFTRKIINGEPIDVFNHGKMKEDFTYDDLVESVCRLIEIAPKKWYTKHVCRIMDLRWLRRGD